MFQECLNPLQDVLSAGNGRERRRQRPKLTDLASEVDRRGWSSRSMTFIADTNARRGLVRIPRLPLVFVLQVWSVKTCQIAPSTSSPRIPRTFLQQLDDHSVGSLGARRQSSRKRPEQHYITNPSSSPSSTFKMSEPPAPLTSMFQATFSNMTDSQLRQTISQLSSAASRPLTRPVPHFRRTDTQGTHAVCPLLAHCRP
jgi:hypothetical protein